MCRKMHIMLSFNFQLKEITMFVFLPFPFQSENTLNEVN